MRTRIHADEFGFVHISYDDLLTGERRERTFFCPIDGGYVRESDRAGRYPQVCDGLSTMGSTLTSSSRDALPALIRREYRRMRAAEKRFMRG